MVRTHESGTHTRGLLPQLRRVGPLLPRVLRRLAARAVNRIETRHGVRCAVAGQRVRLLPNSIPTVLTHASDERARIDALQLVAFAKAIAPGDVVADVGAYRGTYTVVAAACAGPAGRVFAFEPTRTNAADIARNLRLNQFEARAHIELAAVSAAEGTATFYTWGAASTNSLMRQHAEAAAELVRTVSLDAYFRHQHPPHVVKIDIEGGEILALRGAQQLLASAAFMICELHPYAWDALGSSAEELRALLRKHHRYTADIETGEEIVEYRYGAVLLRKHS